MRSIIFFLCIFLAGTGLRAQEANIRVKGQIFDKELRQGVPFATLLINRKAILTEEDGTFSADIPKAAQYHIEAGQIGYESTIRHLDGFPEKGLEIILAPRPVWISEILVAGQKRPGIAQSGIVYDDVQKAVQPRDVGDLLRQVPGFAMVKRGGYALDPVFRSFKYEQLNVVYDGGVELTHACPNRMDPTTTHVNPEEISKIELIRGPFSVRYGPSMGGIINIVTETPFQNSSSKLGGMLEGGYEFNGAGKTTRLSLFSQKGNYHLAASGGLKDFGNYANGAGKDIPTSFKSYDYALKAGIQIDPAQQVQLTWRQGFVRDVLHAGLMMDTDYDNTSMAIADYRWRRPGSALHELNAKVYGSFVDHQMSNLLRPNAKVSQSVANVTAATLGGRMEATLLSGNRQWWFAGADLRYLSREGNRVRTQKRNMMTGEPLPMPMVFQDTIWPDAFIVNAGLFLEGRRLLSERLTLLTGIRADIVRTDAQKAEKDFSTLYGEDLQKPTEVNIGGTASLAWQLSPQFNAQLALGRGVRTANMIERYINHFNVGSDPYEYVGDPRLKPEANHQAELSLQWENERIQIGVQTYYSYITNYITAAVDSSLKRKFMPMAQPRVSRRFVNIDAAQQMGFELLAAVQLIPRLKLSGSLAYTHARNLDWDEPLAEIAPLEGVARLNYTRNAWWAEFRGRFVAAQDRVSPTFAEPSTKGFQTFDLQCGITPLHGLDIGIGLLNIFNANYWEHLNRAYVNMPEQGILYEPGRNLTVLMKYAF